MTLHDSALRGLPTLLSSADVEAVFHRSARTIRRWVARKILNPVELHGSIFFLEDDIRALIDTKLRRAVPSRGGVEQAPAPSEVTSAGN